MKSLDPNVILPALLAIATWVYHKVKGDKTASVRSVLESVVSQVVNSPLVNLDNVKVMAESRILEALTRAKVPAGALRDALVHEFVEYAAAQLHERWAKMQADFDALKTSVNVLNVATPAPAAQ